MDLTYDAYNFLYNTNDGQRFKILELNLIIQDQEDVAKLENFLEYARGDTICETVKNMTFLHC